MAKTMAKKSPPVDETARQRLSELAWETEAVRLGQVWVVRCRKEGKRLTIYGSTAQEAWQEAVKRAEAKAQAPTTGRKTPARPR